MQEKKYKVALLGIVLNPPYWQYVKPMIDSARKFFLPNHDVDYLLWSDVPENDADLSKLSIQFPTEEDITKLPQGYYLSRESIIKTVDEIRGIGNLTVFPTESIQWPFPTLFRYHMFLQQEELLSAYDYVFYCDVDMLFVDTVGDEILGDGLTATVFPMFTLLKGKEYAPFEPNPKSRAFVDMNDFFENHEPKYYYAGGFQGGTTHSFIEAMKVMKTAIDEDLVRENYIARWNDESHWNRYLYDSPPSVILDHSYVYPDSLVESYYEKIWGRSYPPKLVTLTKPFSTSKEGGDAVKKMLQTL